MQAKCTVLARRLMPLLIVGIAAWTYVTYGFDATILRDDAFYGHCAQRVADGYPPYVQVFDVKGPLASLVPALGVIAARQVGVPDYRGVQVEFVIIAILLVLAVYLLTQALTGSVTAAALAAVVFLGFEGFIRHAAGCRPKIIMVLLMTLALLSVVRKSWALAGALLAMAALTWQPVGVVGLAALMATLGEPAGRRRRAVLLLLAGGLAVVAAVVAWFAAKGALTELWRAAGVALVYTSARGSDLPLTWRLWRPLRICFEGYRASFMAGGLGFVGLLAALTEAWRRHGGLIGTLTRSRWSGVFGAFAVLAGFSLFDFQRYPDGWVLLPFLSAGLGYLLARALQGLSGPEALIRPGQRPLAAAMVALALFAPTVVHVKFEPGRGLPEELQMVREIVQHLDGAPVQVIGAPEVLYFCGLTNATRHVVVGTGITAYIDALEPGGVAGWLQEIEDANPGLLVCERALGNLPAVTSWRRKHYRLWRDYGEMQAYERAEVPSAPRDSATQ